MREMGIVDEGLALRALQIMGGDLQVFIKLWFELRYLINSLGCCFQYFFTGCCRSDILWVGRRRWSYAMKITTFYDLTLNKCFVPCVYLIFEDANRLTFTERFICWVGEHPINTGITGGSFYFCSVTKVWLQWQDSLGWPMHTPLALTGRSNLHTLKNYSKKLSAGKCIQQSCYCSSWKSNNKTDCCHPQQKGV